MFNELPGKTVKVFLNCTQWNEYAVSGVVTKFDDCWLYLKTKKTVEWIAIAEIKRISIQR